LVLGYTKTMEGEPVYGSKPVVSQGEFPTRIIIAEPYPDLQQFYSLWLRSRGFKDMIITDSGKKCVDEFFKSTNDDEDTKCSSNNFPREAVLILDTHLEDISSIQVAKQIVDRNPNQQIIFTTTLPSDIISQEISSAGLNKFSVLTKPFELSRLLSLIHRSGNKNS
jgi:CheY-like chemotaxis protein